jgi:carbonic anhydrase
MADSNLTAGNRLASVFDDPPRQNVFLLTCMDQRLLDETVHFMNELNLHNRYDQLSLAGGAMGAYRIFGKKNTHEGIFFTHLEKAITVLKRPIKDVFLFEHLDCGAYKYLHPVEAMQKQYENADIHEMYRIHEQELREFARIVQAYIESQHEQEIEEQRRLESKNKKKTQNNPKKPAYKWENIRVSCFIIDLLGKVTQINLPEGQRSTLACRCD